MASIKKIMALKDRLREAITTLNSLKYKFIIKLLYPQVRWGENIRVYGKLFIDIRMNGIVIIEDNVIFRSHTRYNFAGIFKPVSICVLDNATLTIGSGSGLSGTSICVYKSVTIGKYCNFGVNTAVWDTDFHPLDYLERRVHNIEKIRSKPVIIGDDVFIGANSIIMKGVSIGNRAVIGAGSVVTKSIPEDEIWGGNPIACIKRKVDHVP